MAEMGYRIECQQLGKNIYKSDVQVNLELYGDVRFTSPVFEIKLRLPSTVLISGFQISLGALKSTD